MLPLAGLESLRVNRDVVLTIGVFDGVHLGHQHLIGGVVQRAREIDGLGAVLTFHPHPQLVLTTSLKPAYLTTLDDRLQSIAQLGIDFAFTLPFTTELAQVSARDFVATLCRAFRLTELRVGPDFALGHKRQGTIPVLREMGLELGFSVTVAEPWQMNGGIVSSTRIRQHVAAGDVANARRLLGRTYEVSGIVVEGDRRGRTIGFPTANLATDPQLLLPADGVYAVYVRVDDRCYPAVCNIGYRPSFANSGRTFEVHLLDFAGDLYGRRLTVGLVERLRGEVRFAGVEGLIARIQADIAKAREILMETATPCGRVR